MAEKELALKIGDNLQLDVADNTEDILLPAIVRNIRTERGEKARQRHFHHGVE